MYQDKRLTVTVPLIGLEDQWQERYLQDCLQMGADSVFLMAPYDNIVRSRKPVRYAMFSEKILPPAPEQRVCDLPSLELVAHWADCYRELAPKYRAAGIEPYFWLCHTIGHGGDLSTKAKSPFQTLVGADGQEATGCFCPLDEGFRDYLLEILKILAAADIPLILLDDDFRINYHMPAVDIGCFCPLHMERFNRDHGTDFSRAALAERVYGNEGNTRVQFMESVGNTMLELARAMEQAVHSVNPHTRLGLATAMIHYSTEGYELRQLAKALAGPTRPYIRVFGAPYHAKNNAFQLAYTVDTAKHLANHLDGDDVEIIGEGDTYPHTRFFTNRTVLRSYLLASRCAGMRNMLHYPFPFAASPDYETIYVDEACQLKPSMALLDELLPADVTAQGLEPVISFRNFAQVPIHLQMTKRERVWPDEPVAIKMLTQFGIPTAPYAQNSNQPVLLAGYNAYGYTDEEIGRLLDRGAVIDATAAAWLLERGHDIGLEAVSALHAEPTFELYCAGPFSDRYQNEQVWMLNAGATAFFHLQPKAAATVAGYYINGENGSRTPSCVAYCHGKRKVFVLGFDFFSVRSSFQAVNNVARAEQMRHVCAWLGVAHVENQEFLYANVYRKANRQTICLVQTNTDPCEQIRIHLRKCPVGPISFYDAGGKIHAPVYGITQTEQGYSLRVDHTMRPGDLLVLTYDVN